MNIVWNENPLKSVIELTEEDKKVFLLKLRLFKLKGNIIAAYMELTRQAPNIKLAIHHLHFNDNYTDDDFKIYFDSLSEEHLGDCVCQPCSCLKCFVEELLEIDTLGPGFTKNIGNHISSAFEKDRNLDDAIDYLKNYSPEKNLGEAWNGKDASPYFERWSREAALAYDYLVKYKAEHFSNT